MWSHATDGQTDEETEELLALDRLHSPCYTHVPCGKNRHMYPFTAVPIVSIAVSIVIRDCY